eukprot:314445-Pyramimonas_sp.AAC.1
MLLCLGVLVLSSPRVSEVEGMLSKVSPTGNSILAGCAQSMPWVKALLHDVLRRAHHRLPRVPVQSHVDDIAQCALGTSKYIMSVVMSAVPQFSRGVAACACKVYTKSGVVASCASLQRA